MLLIAVIGIISVLSTAFLYDEPRNFEITKNMDIFFSVFKEINTYYVDEIDPGQTIKNAIDAMLAALDPYTVFYPESMIEDFKFMTTGEYGGIGAVVQKRGDTTMVIEVYENSSAANNGLKAGDQIVKIGNVSIANKTFDEIGELLKGKQNNEIDLTIRRWGVNKDIVLNVKQEKISIPSVPYAAFLKDSIAYIRFNSFTENSGTEFAQALKELQKQTPLKGVIIDLRNNPGGLLSEAIKIVNLFVPRGQLIVETRGKVEQWNTKYFAEIEPDFPDVPLTVIVNRGSASASEIVSGSLQDLDRAVIIGERTYGKGLVQTTRKLAYNTRIKVTMAKYYIPSGRCIQALDYSHRNADGSVSHVPDSLISKFLTKNGRTVYDGGGILPDVLNDTIEYDINFQRLMDNYYFFDFATEFCAQNAKILSPETFVLDNSILNSFFSFLNDDKFVFESKADVYFANLKTELKSEKRLSEFSKELDVIKSKLDESAYLLKQKDDYLIKKYLGSEIVSRYFYQKGRIQYHLRYDASVDKAISILENQEQYRKIVSGK
jgi:carboxyl-terminal processing protease